MTIKQPLKAGASWKRDSKAGACKRDLRHERRQETARTLLQGLGLLLLGIRHLCAGLKDIAAG